MAKKRRGASTSQILRKWLQKRWKVLLAFLVIVSATIAVSVWLFDFTTLQNIILLLVAAVVGTLGVLSDIKSVFGTETQPSGETKVEGEQVQVISGEGARGVQVKNGDYFEGGTHIHPPPPDKPTPQPTVIPGMRSPVYISRGAVEDELRAALRRAGANALVGAVGAGGVGKTELAKQLARELREQGKPVLWLETAGRSLEQVHAEMARALGVSQPPGTDKAERKAILDSALQASPHTIFIDDVRHGFLADLPYCLPPSPPCAALVTSRIKDLPGLLPGAVRDLDVMDLRQARALLRSYAGVKQMLDAEPGTEAGIIEKCGRHPLALSLAAARLVNRPRFSQTPAADLLRTLEHRLDELKRSGEDKDANLRANFELSYAELSDKEKCCFRTLAVFAPSGFGLPGAAAVWKLDEPAAQDVLERLWNRSLLLRAEAGPGRWRLHDLLRDFAAEKLRQCGETGATQRRLAEFLIALFDEHFTDDLSNAPEVGLEQDNLVAAAGYARTAQDGPLLTRLATVPHNWLFNIFRVYGDWEAWLRAALEIGPGDDRLSGDINQCLGDVQVRRYQYDQALESYARALPLFQTEGNRLGEANTFHSTGYVQTLRDQYDQALESYARALDLFQAVGDRLGEANTLQSTGDVHLIHSQYDQALESYARALPLFQAVSDRLGEANTLRSIGEVYWMCNQYDQALESYAHALPLFQAVGARLGEANTLRFTGNVYLDRGEYDLALESYARALDLYQQVECPIGEANTIAGQGQVLLVRGDQAEADRLLAHAVDICTAVGDRYSIAAQIGNYGWTLYDQGKKAEARPYLLRAAEVFDEIGLKEQAERARQLAAED